MNLANLQLNRLPFLVFFYIMAASGCAIKTPHLPISQFPTIQRAMYFSNPLPYRVIVLPLKDLRPEEERQGKKASAMFLLVWNKRTGDYYTGDRIFGQDVSGQLSDQLAAYLRAANVFSDTVPPSAGIQTTPDEGDFLLSGELQHFYGSQHQNFSMYVLPLYFASAAGWQDAKGLPWGKTSVRFTLSDGLSGDMLWAQLIEADATMPREKDSMAEAAMESFINAAGQLSTQLRQLPLESLQQAPGDSEQKF